MLQKKLAVILAVGLAISGPVFADEDVLLNDPSTVGGLVFTGGARTLPERSAEAPSRPTPPEPPGDPMAEGDKPLSQGNGSTSFGVDDSGTDIIDLVGG